MSYTNVELVGIHLAGNAPRQDQVADQVLTLSGSAPVTFFDGAVDAGSVRVKSIHGHQLTRNGIALSSAGVALSSSPIVPGSVVVAGDTSLGNVYKENVDYVVGYRDGALAIKAGGGLGVGAQAIVWYQAYAVYVEGRDYRLDAPRGQLNRLSGGGIGDGERVWLDYRPVLGSFEQAMLEQAVTEANGTVEREIDPHGQFGADPILQAAATYCALSIVCRSAAVRSLATGYHDDKTALAWMKLADTFAERSQDYLTQFHPPAAGLSAPVRA